MRAEEWGSEWGAAGRNVLVRVERGLSMSIHDVQMRNMDGGEGGGAHVHQLRGGVGGGGEVWTAGSGAVLQGGGGCTCSGVHM